MYVWWINDINTCKIFIIYQKKKIDTIDHYYNIASGKVSKAEVEVPIFHSCLSHVMKIAKDV